MSHKPDEIISHWNFMVEGLEASPQDFFTAVERAIKERVVPDTKLERIKLKEGGLLSSKRLYLQVRRKKELFDICGAPFGNSFFVSWWLGYENGKIYSMLCRIPIIGLLVEKFSNPMTYYQLDTAMMFQSAIHSAVTEVLDDMIDEKGIRAMTEAERKPVMRDFFGK